MHQLPGNPYEGPHSGKGHSGAEELVGNEIEPGYRGHNAPPED